MLIVDTSVLLAAVNVRESCHYPCAELLRSESVLFITAPVVTETSIMLNRRLGAAHEARFLFAIAAGSFQVVELNAADYRRTAELVAAYDDLNLGFVDASIVAVVERLGAIRIATLNHRDFTVVKPAHTKHFTLQP